MTTLQQHIQFTVRQVVERHPRAWLELARVSDACRDLIEASPAMPRPDPQAALEWYTGGGWRIDSAGEAIHISSVMEVEIKRPVFQCPDLVGDLANPKRQTLGVLPYLRRSDDLDGNWQRIQAYIATHWNEHPDPDDPDRTEWAVPIHTYGANRYAHNKSTLKR
jgi:hypothetical protein